MSRKSRKNGWLKENRTGGGTGGGSRSTSKVRVHPPEEKEGTEEAVPGAGAWVDRLLSRPRGSYDVAVLWAESLKRGRKTEEAEGDQTQNG